jgi:hypothetical protein
MERSYIRGIYYFSNDTGFIIYTPKINYMGMGMDAMTFQEQHAVKKDPKIIMRLVILTAVIIATLIVPVCAAYGYMDVYLPYKWTVQINETKVNCNLTMCESGQDFNITHERTIALLTNNESLIVGGQDVAPYYGFNHVPWFTSGNEINKTYNFTYRDETGAVKWQGYIYVYPCNTNETTS